MKKRSRIFAFILIVIVFFGVMAGSFMDIVKGITLGLDLQGGFEILYKVQPLNEEHRITEQTLLNTQASLQRRINVIGVSEPELSIEGNDRIRVKLAGITDPDQARRMLSTEAHLSFRDTEDNLLMTGEDLKEGSAKVQMDEFNRPVVAIEFNNADKVLEITRQLLGKPMAIWLDFEEGVDSYYKAITEEDSNMISAPTVNQPLPGKGQISSSVWSYQEAHELASLLNAGALPVQLEELSANSVGAKLGEQAMNLTVRAGIIGGILIIIYMLLYYRIPGIVAGVTLVAYVYLILLVFNWMQATLTLPGIAALVLGVGMAVDANILTYERIKEELRSGKTVMSSFKAGSKRALATIMDANITTVIAASVLFYFGSSAIQGFAVMLIVSIVLSIVTAVFGSRLLLGLLVTSRFLDKKPRLFGVKESEISEL